MTRAGRGRDVVLLSTAVPQASENTRQSAFHSVSDVEGPAWRARLQREGDKSDVQSKPIDRSSPEPLFTPEPSLLGLRQPLP